MPVYKCKTFDKAKKSQWIIDSNVSYYTKVRELFKIAYKLNPVKYPRGVFLYKTFEEANEQRLQWEVENALKK